MADWTWGSDKRPVALTDADIKSVVTAIVEAVTKDRMSDFMEQYRQYARAEAELSKAREELVRKDQEIVGLRTHITTLNGFLTAVAPGAGAPVFHPHSNGSGPTVAAHMVPTFPERFSASVSVPEGLATVPVASEFRVA